MEIKTDGGWGWCQRFGRAHKQKHEKSIISFSLLVLRHDKNLVDTSTTFQLSTTSTNTQLRSSAPHNTHSTTGVRVVFIAACDYLFTKTAEHESAVMSLIFLTPNRADVNKGLVHLKMKIYSLSTHAEGMWVKFYNPQKFRAKQSPLKWNRWRFI